MENRNIYKMDDFLIISSYIMIIPIIVLAWPLLSEFPRFESFNEFLNSAPSILGSRLNMIILYFAGAVSSQIVGRIIRFKEKQSLEILDTLQFYKKSTIPQLSSQLGMSESKILSLVKKMSRIPSLGISLDGEMVNLGAKNETVPENFSSFSDIEEKADEPKTADNFGQEFKNAMNKAQAKDLTDEQKKEELKKVAQSFFNNRQNTGATGKKFNIVLFIILFITPLWPVALIYAISFAVKQQKAAMDKKEE